MENQGIEIGIAQNLKTVRGEDPNREGTTKRVQDLNIGESLHHGRLSPIQKTRKTNLKDPKEKEHLQLKVTQQL